MNLIAYYLWHKWTQCQHVHWFPYDCGLRDWGYAEWHCIKRRWHKDEHMGKHPKC